MFDSLLFFDGFGPMQVAVVLLIALLVFGPKRLPDIGRQIGSAIRELKKAGSEMVNSFNVDHEPDRNAYPYSNGYSQYERSQTYSYPAAGLNDPPDLTDYTLVGQNQNPPSLAAYSPPDASDHALAAESPGLSESAPDAPDAVAAADAQKEGTQNV